MFLCTCSFAVVLDVSLSVWSVSVCLDVSVCGPVVQCWSLRKRRCSKSWVTSTAVCVRRSRLAPRHSNIFNNWRVSWTPRRLNASQLSTDCRTCRLHWRGLMMQRLSWDMRTSLSHRRYCWSLLPLVACERMLPKSQVTRLRQIQNTLARVKAPKIQSHHSHPLVSTLAKDNWAHWIQAPLTHLQSSHNHPPDHSYHL